jgi:hypothetical protein
MENNGIVSPQAPSPVPPASFFCMFPALILPQRKTGSKKTKASLKMLGCRLSLFQFSDLRFRRSVRAEMQIMVPEMKIARAEPLPSPFPVRTPRPSAARPAKA